MSTYTFDQRKTKKMLITFVGMFLILIYHIELDPDITHSNLRNNESVNRRALRNEDENEDENEVVDQSLDVVEDQRPIMHTFFQPVEAGCCGMTESGQTDLIKAWEEAWQSYGWNTRILTESDARAHPDFDLFQEKMTSANVSDYNRRCFWRWLAMAMLENGGWMSDYDNIPLTLTGVMGLELMKEPGLKSWSLHVPALIHADKKSLDILVERFKSAVSTDFVSPDPNTNLVTDMLVILSLHQNLSEEEMDITLWEKRVYSGFPYIMGDTGSKVDCDKAKKYYAAHLSHHAVLEAVEVTHLHPVEGVTVEDYADKRGELARSMIRDYHDNCVPIEG